MIIELVLKTSIPS